MVCIMAFVSMSPRYIPWFYSMFSRIQRCIMMSSRSLTLLTISLLLEIIILCQHLANFRRQFERIGGASLTWTYVLVVVLSFVLRLCHRVRRVCAERGAHLLLSTLSEVQIDW